MFIDESLLAGRDLEREPRPDSRRDRGPDPALPGTPGRGRGRRRALPRQLARALASATGNRRHRAQASRRRGAERRRLHDGHRARMEAQGQPGIWPGMPAADRRAAAEAARRRQACPVLRERLERRARPAARRRTRAPSRAGLILDDDQGEHGVCRVVRTRGVKAVATQWAGADLHHGRDPAGSRGPQGVLSRGRDHRRHRRDDAARHRPPGPRRAGVGRQADPQPRRRRRNRNLQAIRRAILHRHLQLGRQPTLVVAQKAVAEWLRAGGLPAGISVEHFNNVAGLDRYKDVRLLICVGRTMPSVLEVEAFSGSAHRHRGQ